MPSLLPIDSDAIREQCRRITESAVFRQSTVHRDLLRYLIERSLAGQSCDLKEYTVGIEALGRPESYNPKEDSAVRVQMTRLRQKLALYYQEEGRQDPLIIELPRGGFAPDFHLRKSDNLPLPEPRTNWRGVSIVLGSILLIAVAALAYETVWPRREGAIRDDRPLVASSSALRGVWQRFFDDTRPVLVCLGTPLSVEFPGFGIFGDRNLNDWSDVAKSDKIAKIKAVAGEQNISPFFGTVGLGDAQAAFMVGNYLGLAGATARVIASNAVSWQEISESKVVFIGPAKFNRQLSILAKDTEIVPEDNGIRNLKPQPGEPVFMPTTPPNSPGGGSAISYAVISHLPGANMTGDILWLYGTTASGTLGAVTTVTNPVLAARLISRLRGQGSDLPRFFQAVLEVESKDGTPVKTEYLFHHEVRVARSQVTRQ